ncbi:hypothetical protein LIER_08177 [Lithospermum erythrorhizon]|uniref:Stress response NST1-like protein n=1 Tax=Lithospermum erythrorhizon TaxID=34254 RepID=A0AAV3PC23_LITER
MCILCVIQKWSRTVATMLPWLAIPLIGFWALSQLLPPAFRFEITSPRLACVFVLLLTLFWYEILMPQLSVWRAKRNSRLREQKRFEAIEMQKLRKSATRRCRNCLTPYKDQNPGGGKFMCSYCGHLSKRPVLDLPVPPGMGLSNSGILKDLMGRSGKIFNRKEWSDNGWMCGQDWLENGGWASGPFSQKESYWKSGGGISVGDDHFLADKSCSRILIFFSRACKAFILSIIWVWRKFFWINSSRDDVLVDGERRGILDKRGINAGNFQESKSEKARRKAEERRQARLEKELLEEEERKQREEVAKLVEERRRLRDEKLEAEKERTKGSPTVKEMDRKKETERKRQERKKDKDRASSKSNSDVEELEKRTGKDNVRHRKSDNDWHEHSRNGSENVKGHGTGVWHGHRVAVDHHRVNVGTRYLDRMKGTIFSSSHAFTRGGFFGRGTNVTSVSREQKPNSSVEQSQTSAYRREHPRPDRATGKPYMDGDENKNTISRPVLIEPQPCTAPKKSWQQLFTRSPSVAPASSSNIIGRPNGNSHSEVPISQFAAPSSPQGFDNPINFGLPSPFSSPSFSFGSTSNSTDLSLSSEAMFPRIGEKPAQFLPEKSEIFEDPCYVPDPASLLGPVSESLDNFQLDLGFLGDTVLEKPSTLKNIHSPPEVNRPSPIESPMSRLRVPEERHPTSFLFPSTPKAQDVNHVPVDDLGNQNEVGTWQMWSSSPLGPDSSGLFGGSAKWFLPHELNGTKEDPIHPIAPKTMASLFKKDERVLSEAPSPHNNFIGNGQNGELFNSVPPIRADEPCLPNRYFGSPPGNENQLFSKMEESTKKGTKYGSPLGSATEDQIEISTTNCWVK